MDNQFEIQEYINKPISKNWNPDLYTRMVENGAESDIKSNGDTPCILVDKSIIEERISSLPELMAAYVEFYQTSNENYLFKQNIDGIDFEFYFIMRENVLQWFFIALTDGNNMD